MRKEQQTASGNKDFKTFNGVCAYNLLLVGSYHETWYTDVPQIKSL